MPGAGQACQAYWQKTTGYQPLRPVAGLPSSPSSAGHGTGPSNALAVQAGRVGKPATTAMKSQAATWRSAAPGAPATWLSESSLATSMVTFTIISRALLDPLP